METAQTKITTIDDLRGEIEQWRANKPPRKAFFRSMFETRESAIGFLLFFLFVVLSLTVLPLVELLVFLVIRPILAVVHGIMVIVAAVFLRFSVGLLARAGSQAILHRERMFSKIIYSVLPVFLRGFVHVFGTSLKYYLRIDPNDVRSIGKIQEWVDDTVGVEGIWIESDVNRAVRLETWCPYVGAQLPYVKGKADKKLNPEFLAGKTCEGDCSYFCSGFMVDWLNFWVQYYNPDFEVEPVKAMIPAGDEFCEFVYKRRRPFKGGIQ